MAIARFQIMSVGGRGADDVSWRFLSGNNRSVARSVPTYPDVESCMAAIRELREKLPSAVGSTVPNGAGKWTWRIRAEDFDLAVSSGRFERRLRARMACESFMDLVVDARSVDVVQIVWNEVRDRLRQPGGALSGGQQQRLCIARSLAVRPQVLLMDEPCSALDPGSTRRIEETIAELASQVTIVIVTHNMQQAARVSQQCAFFLAEQGTPGAIVEHGTTTQIFDAPVDPRTADYVHGRFG